ITTSSSNPPKTSLYSTDGSLNGCSLSSLISSSTLNLHLPSPSTSRPPPAFPF
ncbi:uncharacterized protein K441DRAFT_662850, partial [Cenococcum geophilum 1.58]|uniref:uncharacterized protein n=1 Tax=Cenococcum geophilum 1.58 TaxID=794803 RepID=UPI00358E28D1